MTQKANLLICFQNKNVNPAGFSDLKGAHSAFLEEQKHNCLFAGTLHREPSWFFFEESKRKWHGTLAATVLSAEQSNYEIEHTVLFC